MVCDDCGLLTTSRSFNIQDSSGITLRNCSERCPACGGRAWLVDGVFDVVDEVFRVAGTVEGGLDAATLQRLLDLLQNAESTGESAESLAARAEDESPELADVLRAVVNMTAGQRWDTRVNTAIAIIMLLLTVYGTFFKPDSPAPTPVLIEMTQVNQQVCSVLEDEPRRLPPHPSPPDPAR